MFHAKHARAAICLTLLDEATIRGEGNTGRGLPPFGLLPRPIIGYLPDPPGGPMRESP